MLYFNNFIVKNLNNSSHILTLKNIYKIFLLPTIGIMTPIVYFILPYLVIRFKFGPLCDEIAVTAFSARQAASPHR